MVLMVATLVLGQLSIANLRARGQTDTSSFEYEANLKIAGFGYSSSSESTSDDRADELRVELALERAEDIRGNVGAIFGFWVVIGALFSGRPRIGPKVGLAASIILATSVFQTNESIEGELSLTRWPLPVSVDLEFTWVYWALLVVTLVATVLNLVRWIVDGRQEREGVPAANEARS